MDADTIVSSPDAIRCEENGVHSNEPYEGDENIGDEVVDGKLDLLQISDANASSEVPYGATDGDMTEPLPVEVISEECKLTNGSPAHGEVGLQEAQHKKASKEQMNQGKSKTAKPLSSKIPGSVGLKKTSKVKEEKVTSINGISSANSRPKQPILTSNRSFNDGKNATGNAKKTKQPSKSQSVHSSDEAVQSNDPMEKTKLKPLALRKEAQHKMEGDQDSIGSPTAGDAKPSRVGKLPAYDFSFRCNERAEKRREFYSKLEEKIHAKEVEIINQEAKSKETQEAELRMLRKSLNFKATPMPNFYQEPTPVKVELKKIPTTRPKSPKLGRRKSSPPPANADVDNSHNNPKGMPDLCVKVPQNKPAKTSSSISHPQKPQRKSLPKLPSQKTSLSKTADKALPSAQDSTNTVAPPTQTEPKAGATELGQTESVAEMEQVVHLEESQAVPAIEQEPVTVEQ